MSSSTGVLFRVSTFGESHGEAIGCVIDGCPAGLPLDIAFIQRELDRRRPGQSAITTQRKESDQAHILSGVFEGRTTGAPIAIALYNDDHRPADYEHLRTAYRPSHADNTWDAKYGIRDHRGGGRASARETAARVAAGAVAKLLLARYDIQIYAWVDQVGPLRLETPDEQINFSLIEAHETRCPDPALAAQMSELIKSVRKEGDTIGGAVRCLIRNCPPGLGQPVFDKLHADLAKAIMSINAVKGFEIGSGFAAAAMRGSQHNDLPLPASPNNPAQYRTATNRSGGIQGGISNGMNISFRAAFKPVATLLRDQPGVDAQGQAITVAGKGRHDPCVVPRAVPIVEAMAAMVIADHSLRARADRV